MELWIGAEFQHDVAEQFRNARRQLEPKINAQLDADYGPAIVKWAIISIIRPRIPDGWGEVWRYHRKRKVVEFRLIIDHNEFKIANPSKQKSMLLASIFRSMDIFPVLNVKGFELDRFRADVQAIAVDKAG